MLYRQPAVLLVYFAVANEPRSAEQNELLTADEMALFYSDLGKPQPSVNG